MCEKKKKNFEVLFVTVLHVHIGMQDFPSDSYHNDDEGDAINKKKRLEQTWLNTRVSYLYFFVFGSCHNS